MVVRRFGVLSVGKVMGVLYALLGLIIGAFYALFALLFTIIGVSSASEAGDAFAGGAIGVLFGVGSIIFFPILYGVLGFILGMISALLYNLVARFVGGVEVDLEQSPRSSTIA